MRGHDGCTHHRSAIRMMGVSVLLLLGASRAYAACGDITIQNSAGNFDGASYSLVLNGCSGALTHFYFNGAEQVFASTPLSYLTLQGGQVRAASQITTVGENTYDVSYQSSSVVVRMTITPKPNHIEFRVAQFTNPASEAVQQIELLRFKPTRILERLDAAELAALTPSSPVFSVVPRTVEARCQSGYWYQCFVTNALRSDDTTPFVNTGVTVIASTFSRYHDAFEEYVRGTLYLPNGALNPACTLPSGDPNPECLPYPVLSDGRWMRKSQQIRESYLFAAIRSDSEARSFSSLMQEGHIPQVLLLDPLMYGMYNQAKTFACGTGDCYAALKTSLQRHFHDKQIRVGMHVFPNLLEPSNTTLLDLANPLNHPNNPSRLPLSSLIYARRIGTLKTSIAAGGAVTNVVLNENLGTSAAFQFYYPNSYFGENSRNILIDNELFACEAGYSGGTLLNCDRPVLRTTASAHTAGASVYIVPQLNGLFINGPKDTDGTGASPLSRLSTNGFCSTLTDLGVSFIYFDGVPFLPVVGTPNPAMADETRSAFAKYGWLPYLLKCQQQSGNHTLPFLVESGYSPFAAYYSARSASDDGVTFQPKDNIKHRVNYYFLQRNPFYEPFPNELGWWKICGSHMQGGEGYQYDFDATTFDDVDYLMTKAVALDVAVGIQLHPTYGVNRRVRELFHRIGLYRQLQARVDAGLTTIPPAVLAGLQVLDQEAELRHPDENVVDPAYIADPYSTEKKYIDITTPGYNFVRKAVYRKTLGPGDNSMIVANPFGAQKLRLELRARPSFHPDSDTTRNITVAPSSMVKDKTGTGVQCPATAGGAMSISNTSSTASGCRYRVGSFVLRNRRGFRVRLRHTPGTNGYNGVVMVRVQDGPGIRDYKLPLNFSGERTVTLADPTTDTMDHGSSYLWDGTFLPKSRHWDINFGRVSSASGSPQVQPISVYLYVNNVLAGAALSLEILDFKVLDELPNGSPMVNPTVTVNGQSIVFPTALTFNDTNAYLLEYDGNTRTFQTLTSGFGSTVDGCPDCVGPTLVNDPILLAGGTAAAPAQNTLTFTAASGNSQRAEVIVTVYDDEDGDGIPTRGDFGATPAVTCSGSNQFCNDPCPNFYNPAITGCSDAIAPVVAVSSPLAGHVSQLVSIQSAATDNIALASMTVEIDGVTVASCASSPCNINWDTTQATNGAHTIRVTARDRATPQNAGVATVNVVVDNAAPSVSSFSVTPTPQNGSVTGIVTFSVNGADNSGGSGLQRVDFLDNGVVIGSTSTIPGTFAWNTATVAIGPHTVQAIAYDRQGNASPPATLSLTVQNPLSIISWKSIRTHGPSGELSLSLNPAASGNGVSGPSVEPRAGGIQKIRIEFNKPITLLNPLGITAVGRATVSNVMGLPVPYIPSQVLVSGTQAVDVLFNPVPPGTQVLPDGQCYTFTVLAGSVIGKTGELLTGDLDVHVRSLAGDVSPDGEVTLGDAMLSRRSVGNSVVAAPAIDTNCTGGNIDLGDPLFVKSRIGQANKTLCP